MENRNIVINSWGTTIAKNDNDWETIVNYMDRDVAEEIHLKLAPCSNQEFFDAYCEAHEKNLEKLLSGTPTN